MEKLGVSATQEDFITSSQATAYYLKEHHVGKKLYVCDTRSLIAQLAMAKWGYTKEQTVVIGDRIYTDVKSGLNAGVHTISVFSGESTLQTLAESLDKPHLVLENAGQLIFVVIMP